MQSPWVPSIVSGLVAAILTSLLTPTIHHFFWKAQKLREEKLALAERLAALTPKLVLLFSPDTDQRAWNALVGEFDAVLYACQVLFTRATREACVKFHFLLRRWQWNHESATDIREIDKYFDEAYQSSADVLAALYGEVFSRSITANWYNPYIEKHSKQTDE